MRLLLRAVCAIGIHTVKPVAQQTARYITRPPLRQLAAPGALKSVDLANAHARCVHVGVALCKKHDRRDCKKHGRKVGTCGKRLRRRKKKKKSCCVKNPTICYDDLDKIRKHQPGPCCPCEPPCKQDPYRRQ